jgi:hypothetical protein
MTRLHKAAEWVSARPCGRVIQKSVRAARREAATGGWAKVEGLVERVIRARSGRATLLAAACASHTVMLGLGRVGAGRGKA